jgi:formylglycine-generating enzyme required for sulfatase activity
MYYRTYSNSGNGPTGEADPATVSSFRLDKYLVTVGRFRQFVKAWDGAAGYYPPTGSGKHTYLNCGLGLANSAIPGTFEAGWVASDNIWIAPEDANLAATPYCSNYATWTAMAGGQESLPINCVTWQEAYAFCIWDGGFLPSEAEWGYAAAGGNQQREYPWGSAAPGATNQYAIYGCDYPSDSKLGCFAASVAPVGTTTLGVGRWGQLDLAGEVFEWNLDWYASYRNPCTNCAYLEETVPGLVSRGGSFYVGAQTLQSSLRFSDLPSYFRDFNIGFRCARAP